MPVGENGIASNGDMVRIDVFCEENKGKKKYYFVPIYVSDVVKKGCLIERQHRLKYSQNGER